MGWKLGGFCRERNGYGFQNEDGRDGKCLKLFLKEAKMFGEARP